MKRLLVGFSILLATQVPIAAVHAQDTVTAADAYAEAELLLRELERIRQYMGVRLPRSSESRMRGAEPRQVFYQVQGIFRKSNLLANQLSGVSRSKAPVAPETIVSVGDLIDILKATRQQLDIVEEALDISRPLTEPRKIKNPDISATMLLVIDADFLLNRLTGFRAEWSDIYDRVIQIMTYVGGALPEEVRYPALEPHEPGKMPQDVGVELFTARVAAAPASRAAGVSVIETTIVKGEEGGLSAEGVSYLSTTLLHDFAEITFRLRADDIDPPDYPRPARVFSSQVYQLAVALRKQAEMLGAEY
ncbi:MAG: hypothetical protein OES38_05565 [Gammaproteobacteria bacterium]|nr:hypothetical protein [Gammaproteobacteria bacterium]